MTDPAVGRIREVFHYEPETGILARLVSTSNRARVGAIAGYINNKGYRAVRLDGRTYQVHRLIWLYMTGEWPKHQIDHINLDKADNRWVNLREATRTQNKANSRVKIITKSGIKGVYGRGGKWMSAIRVGGKTNHLGYFGTPELAAVQYAIAAQKYFGEFARPTLPAVVHEIVFGRFKGFEKAVLRNLADLSIYTEAS